MIENWQTFFGLLFLALFIISILSLVNQYFTEDENIKLKHKIKELENEKLLIACKLQYYQSKGNEKIHKYYDSGITCYSSCCIEKCENCYLRKRGF
ncbi:MAG: hypothetical protein FWE02_07485 [Defluviitaleaceae bacterium]|nr:hypothetical protein [Defluviitaleaceae bacterium]